MLYSIALFLHVSGAIGLFIAMSLYLVGGNLDCVSDRAGAWADLRAIVGTLRAKQASSRGFLISLMFRQQLLHDALLIGIDNWQFGPPLMSEWVSRQQDAEAVEDIGFRRVGRDRRTVAGLDDRACQAALSQIFARVVVLPDQILRLTVDSDGVKRTRQAGIIL